MVLVDYSITDTYTQVREPWLHAASKGAPGAVLELSLVLGGWGEEEPLEFSKHLLGCGAGGRVSAQRDVSLLCFSPHPWHDGDFKGCNANFPQTCLRVSSSWPAVGG